MHISHQAVVVSAWFIVVFCCTVAALHGAKSDSPDPHTPTLKKQPKRWSTSKVCLDASCARQASYGAHGRAQFCALHRDPGAFCHVPCDAGY